MLDALGRLSFVSDRFCDIAGQPRERLQGQPLTALVCEPERAVVEAAMQAAMAGRDGRLEVTLALPSGQAPIVSMSLRRLALTEGRAAVTLAVLSDVTEHRRMEEQARLHLQQLAHMGRLKSMDEMAIALAHEITQPLTAIMSYTQAGRRLLRAESADFAALSEALAGADAEAKRARAIVHRIRGFVQNRPSHPVRIDAGYLVSESVRFAEPEARQLGIELYQRADKNTGSVFADPVQIQQVLLNLMRNAMESIGTAISAPRQVRVIARPAEGRMVEFSVEDSGPGVPPEHAERVFEPFFSTREGGVGIGLALCRAIVEAHGGRIWVETHPEYHGAAFRFNLPASRDGH